MRLSPTRFNRLLRPPAGLGQSVRWRRGFNCPCTDPWSGQARQGCATCQGRGVFWNAPIKAWTGLTSLKVAREWAAFGAWESGDVVLSIPSDSPLYAAGENDRVMLTDSSEPFQMTLSRTAGSVSTPTSTTIVSLDRLFWLDANDAVVDGTVPAVNDAGELAWGDEGVPPEGEKFTIAGRRRPEYFIWRELPQDRAHHGGAALPRRVAARRFDLFGR